MGYCISVKYNIFDRYRRTLGILFKYKYLSPSLIQPNNVWNQEVNTTGD